MTHTLKTIGYAYRSSEIAARLSAAHTGCYYVALKHDEPTPLDLRTLAGSFETIEQAERYAATLPHPFSVYSMRFKPE